MTGETAKAVISDVAGLMAALDTLGREFPDLQHWGSEPEQRERLAVLMVERYRFATTFSVILLWGLLEAACNPLRLLAGSSGIIEGASS